jgi:hypothetical protein
MNLILKIIRYWEEMRLWNGKSFEVRKISSRRRNSFLFSQEMFEEG